MIELLALDLAGRAELEAVHYERVVVLTFALLVSPVAGSDPRLQNELIAFTRVLGDRLTECAEGNEPQTGHDLARRAVLVLAGVVVADKAEARVDGIAFGDEFWVL